MEILTKQIVIQSKSLDEIERLVSDKEKLLSAIPSIQPIKNSDLTRLWHQDLGTELIHLINLEECTMEWILLHQEIHLFMLQVMVK